MHIFSNKISKVLKNKPILILNFNANTNQIVVPNSDYEAQLLVIDGRNYWNLTIFNSIIDYYSVYIFDHQIEPATSPKIIISSNNTNSFLSAVNIDDVS